MLHHLIVLNTIITSAYFHNLQFMPLSTLPCQQAQFKFTSREVGFVSIAYERQTSRKNQCKNWSVCPHHCVKFIVTIYTIVLLYFFLKIMQTERLHAKE